MPASLPQNGYHLRNPDKTLIIQFVETQTGIGMDRSAIKSSKAVDRDRIGIVFFKYRFHSHIKGCGGFQCFDRYINNSRRFLPVIYNRSGYIFIAFSQALLTSSKPIYSSGIPIISWAGPGLSSITASIFDSFIRRRHSSADKVCNS